MDQTLLLWGGFTLFIIAMLALDIGLFIERRMSSVRVEHQPLMRSSK